LEGPGVLVLEVHRDRVAFQGERSGLVEEGLLLLGVGRRRGQEDVQGRELGGLARISHGGHGIAPAPGTLAAWPRPLPRPHCSARAALLQRLAAVRGRLSPCADQAAAAKCWLSMPMASVSAEGPMPKALSTRRTSPLMPGCRHQGRACPLRRARMTSNPLIVA